MLFFEVCDMISSAIGSVNRLVWGKTALSLFMGTGILMTFVTRGVQIRHFALSIKLSLGKLFAKSDDKGGVSPFQSLCTALAATVGTGNIAGVASALTLGGPGAVFWMWVSAFFGMCTKYAEVVLSVKYREKNTDGEYVGGPMYYIKNGLGSKYMLLSRLFCIFCILASFGIGNMAQVNNISESVYGAVRLFANIPEQKVRLCVGIAVMLAVGAVSLGGAKRVGKVSELIIPFMSIFYILACSSVILANREKLPGILSLIISSALNPKSAFAGFFGHSVGKALRQGVSKGVFSNEAGLGSSTIAHAASLEKSPVRQGMLGIFEVFADTVVLCSLTAFAVLASGIYIPYGKDSGTPLVTESFSTIFGQKISYVAVSIAICFFAFSTLLSWSLYGVRCVEFLFGKKGVIFYRIIFLPVIVVGATVSMRLVWNISDMFNGLMALPNLFALIRLRGVVRDETLHFFGRDGTFVKNCRLNR